MTTLLRRCTWLGLCLTLAVLLLGSGYASQAAQTTGLIYYVTVERGLTTPAASMIRRALREAEAANATALVIEARGGGSLSAAWPLARELEAASVPIVTYIGPRDAAGGPVGTLLISAGHVAVMAPGASIGFAAPLVDVPAGFSSSTQQLVVEDAVKQLASWARARNRNVDWIEQAVRSGAIIQAERAQALNPPLIDLVATPDELLTSLQGRRVTLTSGAERTLQTLGAQVQFVEPTVWEGLGQLLALPTIAFVLFVVGGIALYLELANPGVGIPGIAGGLLIVAALIGFALGEVRPLAVLLLAAGLVVVGLEHVIMSHGGLTVAGLVLLILGALFLVDSARSPGLGVSYLAIGGVALLLGGAATGLVALAVRVRSQRPVTGRDALIGQIAEVRRPVAPEGLVFVNGALWSAWTDQGSFAPGELVEVAAVDGLRLYVRAVREES
jgi:membrane-bound serine protease (ClpP class)